ncbi:MAG: tRNA epoxyqueuosine(34) reductase QueG [Gammaproteobacteria bacterium]|uniref:tRNA epoxyqueuosine(34) reductase QueG n=1 Tax=Nevskia sp. TaxID=1929292 RepID=UPI0040374804|nr:tRNA epoxyqueuosine(34) reductase QueG [Gammaproteobacteria bacterium]
MPTSPAPPPLPRDWPALIRSWAQSLGFADAAIATLTLDEDSAHLQRWLAEGRHGGMAWMAEHAALRADPARLQPGTVTVISARLDYRPSAADAEALLADPEAAYISRYALGRDYHKLMRQRLKKLAERLAEEIAPHGYRVFADSAPLLEKALARNAGLGWIGKHTLVLNREAGSWFFLGEICTDLPIAATAAEPVTSRCGSCTACLDICPTRAITGPYQLDARRCISYLTIEHHGDIPEDLRPLIGNRIFGCDDCQLACPWNRYAKLDATPDFAPRHGLDSARLIDLFAWTEADYLQRTEGMALRRAGYARWLRNLAVAIGNALANPATTASAATSLVAALQARAAFPDSTVQSHIRWALTRRPAADSRSPCRCSD